MARRQDRDTRLVFLMGLVTGAIVGGAFGLLLTPKSVIDSRAKVRQRAARLRGSARSLGETSLDLLREAYRDGGRPLGRMKRGAQD